MTKQSDENNVYDDIIEASIRKSVMLFITLLSIGILIYMCF